MPIPSGYKAYLLRHWQSTSVERLLCGLDSEPSVSIRLNPSRLSSAAALPSPTGADGNVPWCAEGFYLNQRPVFTADPLFHAGFYYVQEASSMFLAHVLRQLPIAGLRSALDLCAAPGGKSTLLRSLLPYDCLLVANEPVRNRAQVLAENMAKWGHPNVVVTQTNAADIADCTMRRSRKTKRDEGFGLVLADVPCSGEGMFRKEPEAVAQWSPDFVADCAALQRSIVADVWPALRPGGLLIYSTCTFNPEEDEENVSWICRELGAEPISIPVDEAWHIAGDLRRETTTPLPCYHFLPGQTRGEGFFMAVLRKHGEAEDLPVTEEPSDADSQRRGRKGDKRGRTADTLADTLRQQLPTLPTNLLDEPGTPCVELSLDDAIRYLQRESLMLPPGTPRGHVTATFQAQRLGLMNSLGTRANNLYPKEWRIRSGHLTPQTLFPDLASLL